MSENTTEKTAEQIAEEMKQRKTSNSSPIANFFGLTVSSGDESSGDEGDGSPHTLGSQPVATTTTVEQFEKDTPNQTETLGAKKVQGGEGKEQEGGVMHWLGLAGGRKRRRKKSRKKKKKSKSKKRRRKSHRRSRSRRGGIVCKGFKGTDKGPECPCPKPEGKRPSVPMAAFTKAQKDKKTKAKAARLKWDKQNAKYQECMSQQHNAVYWKKWQLQQQGVTGAELEKQRKDYYESIKGTGVTGAEHNQREREKAAKEEQERRDGQGMFETAIQAGIDKYDDVPSAAAPGGGRRRKSRRKKRRKSKKRKSRRRRKKSRRRRK